VTRRINLDNAAVVIAQNRCCECSYEWQDEPMGFARYMECPRCGSEYWEWTDHGDIAARPNVKLRNPV
jgi:predicted Zn-ribbon and HTH transcriptional regulator